jgi:hypothetical protein
MNNIKKTIYIFFFLLVNHFYASASTPRISLSFNLDATIVEQKKILRQVEVTSYQKNKVKIFLIKNPSIQDIFLKEKINFNIIHNGTDFCRSQSNNPNIYSAYVSGILDFNLISQLTNLYFTNERSFDFSQINIQKQNSTIYFDRLYSKENKIYYTLDKNDISYNYLTLKIILSEGFKLNHLLDFSVDVGNNKLRKYISHVILRSSDFKYISFYSSNYHEFSSFDNFKVKEIIIHLTIPKEDTNKIDLLKIVKKVTLKSNLIMKDTLLENSNLNFNNKINENTYYGMEKLYLLNQKSNGNRYYYFYDNYGCVKKMSPITETIVEYPAIAAFENFTDNRRLKILKNNFANQGKLFLDGKFFSIDNIYFRNYENKENIITYKISRELYDKIDKYGLDKNNFSPDINKFIIFKKIYLIDQNGNKKLIH